jgi:hypothetical protein
MKQTEIKAFSELLSATADYYGKPLKPSTIRIYWNALSAFDFQAVRALVSEHVKTSRFMPTVAELLDAVALMDGRPGVEEAWALCAKSLNDEGVTIVWTEEIAEAFGSALNLNDDRVAARMAFKERYENLTREARRQGKPVRWVPSLGHDPNGREGPLLQAVNLGRLPLPQVQALLPNLTIPATLQALLKPTQNHLSEPPSPALSRINYLIEKDISR